MKIRRESIRPFEDLRVGVPPVVLNDEVAAGDGRCDGVEYRWHGKCARRSEGFEDSFMLGHRRLRLGSDLRLVIPASQWARWSERRRTVLPICAWPCRASRRSSPAVA